MEAFASGGGSGNAAPTATGGGEGNGGGGITVDVWWLSGGASEPTGAVARATAPAAILCLRRAAFEAPLSLLLGLSELVPNTRLGSAVGCVRSDSAGVVRGIAYDEFAAMRDLWVR